MVSFLPSAVNKTYNWWQQEVACLHVVRVIPCHLTSSQMRHGNTVAPRERLPRQSRRWAWWGLLFPHEGNYEHQTMFALYLVASWSNKNTPNVDRFWVALCQTPRVDSRRCTFFHSLRSNAPLHPGLRTWLPAMSFFSHSPCLLTCGTVFLFYLRFVVPKYALLT